MNVVTKVCVAVAFAFLPTWSYAQVCDYSDWASCEDITGNYETDDCSSIDCDRDPTAWDEYGEPIAWGAQYCPQFAGNHPTFAYAWGDVLVRIAAEEHESGYSGWTTGSTVLCTREDTCTTCEANPGGIYFVTWCKATSTSWSDPYVDAIPVSGTECYVEGDEC